MFELYFSPPFRLNLVCADGAHFLRMCATDRFHVSGVSGWAYLWEVFGRQVEPVASRLPWMVAIGNHGTCGREVDVVVWLSGWGC